MKGKKEREGRKDVINDMRRINENSYSRLSIQGRKLRSLEETDSMIATHTHTHTHTHTYTYTHIHTHERQVQCSKESEVVMDS